VKKQRLEDWVLLSLASADAPRSAWRLIKAFPQLADLGDADPEELSRLRLDKKVIERLLDPEIKMEVSSTIETARQWGVELIPFDAENYPPQLREIYDPPFLLYAWGETGLLGQPGVAVVGTRQASLYGLQVAERLAEDLASRGVVVISGLALGIDTAAHRGALRGGVTVAVFGAGLDWVYPHQNRSLAEKIKQKGLLLSEYPFRTRPIRFHFPLRNRIIAGLSLACVVVEAARRSGSLITACLALESNREVLAVPGNVSSKVSQGTNWLIQGGAKLVQSWEDVVEELPEPWRSEIKMKESTQPERKRPILTSEEEEIWQQLSGDQPRHIDDLAEMTNRSISELLVSMLNLELKGYVQPLAGKFYIRRDYSS